MTELLRTFRNSVPPDAFVTSNEATQVKEVAVRLGVINRLQCEAPGRHSNVISRELAGTIYLMVRSYDTTGREADHYWGAMIHLAPLRGMVGGMELVMWFFEEFFGLFTGGVPGEDIGRLEFN